MDEAIKLYEFEYSKPELEDAVIHYGIKGMHWGIRKDGKPQGYQGSGKGRGGKKVKSTGSKVRAAKKQQIGKNKSSQGQKDIRKVTNKDIEDLNRNKEKYSTNEINEILNRYNTEQRLSDLNSKINPTTKEKAKKVVTTIKQHPYIVAIPVGVLLGVAHAAKYYRQGVIPDMPDSNSKYAQNFLESYVDFYKRGSGKTKKAVNFIRNL